MKRFVLACALFAATVVSASGQAQQQDQTQASTATNADVAALERDYQQVLADVDELKRQNAEQQATTLVQKEQWGQGFGFSFGLTQSVSSFDSPPTKESLGVVFPSISNTFTIEALMELGMGPGVEAAAGRAS